MTDRKNIKVDEEIHERLAERKGKHETWNGFFDRVLRGMDDE